MVNPFQGFLKFSSCPGRVGSQLKVLLYRECGEYASTLRNQRYSKLYPLISINYVLALIAGRVVFGEALTLAKVAGIALIAAGVLVIAVAG